MPLYEYEHCGEVFELLRPMSEYQEDGECPKCGRMASKVPSISYAYWPWILTEASHHPGAKDEWVPDKPSNDMIVDNTKDPYVKTIYKGRA